MEKLRPEQKKLWRRTYLDLQARGRLASECAECADATVAMWEERGAFDETRREPDTGLAWRLVAEVLREHHPDALVLIIQTLADAEQQARAALSANVCDTGAASALEATGSVVDFLGTLKALERYVDETGALHVRVPADLPPKP